MSMKAVAITHHGKEDRLTIVQIAKPSPGAQDLLIKVHAFSLNPVDVKICHGMMGEKEGDPVTNDLKILGYDGSGVVEDMGSEVTGFQVGDEVYFSGSIGRAGCNAEYVLEDFRFVAHKPKSVDHLTASSFALCTLTAWEAFEGKMHIPIPSNSAEAEENSKKVVFITAGAGGVGSVAIQLAKKVFKIGKVVATASRPDSTSWCYKMGADLVVDRTKDWKSQLQDAGIHAVDYILACASVDDTLDTMVSLCNPWGHIVGIVVNEKPLNMAALFMKSLSFTWEFMGCRPLHHWQLEKQGDILRRFAKCVDDGLIQSWVGETFDEVTLENMRAAHIQQISGSAIGKIAFNAKF